MNMDGAFILAENTQEERSAFCWQQHADISQIYLITILGRCLSHVSHCAIRACFRKHNIL